MRVLDVGCGTGDDVRQIAALVADGGFVAGIDPSATMIDEARARGVPANSQFLLASAYDVPFEDASFDAIRAERVFQHLAEPEKAALELRRLVKPDGTVLLLDQDWDSLSVAGADRETTRRIVRSFSDRFANPWAGREARGLLHRAGFPRVDVAPLIATPTLPIAFDLILKSAVDAALAQETVDSEAAHRWLARLLQADQRGEFYCAVVVVVALGWTRA